MNTDSQNINKSLFSSEKLVFIGSAFWWFSLYIYVPILPIFSKDLGANLGFVGLIVASYSIGQILFRMPIGYLSDRLKSRKLFSVFTYLIRDPLKYRGRQKITQQLNSIDQTRTNKLHINLI